MNANEIIDHLKAKGFRNVRVRASKPEHCLVMWSPSDNTETMLVETMLVMHAVDNPVTKDKLDALVAE